MKGILTVCACIVSALNVLAAVIQAEPVVTCSLPAVGNSFQQDIPADAFRGADEVEVLIQQIPAGRIQAAVWDDGDNAVTCRFVFSDEAKTQSPCSTSLLVRDNVECHIAEQTLSTAQTGCLVVSRNKGKEVKQPVHVNIGMLSQSQTAAAQPVPSAITIDLPISTSRSEKESPLDWVPVWAWIATGCVFLGCCVLLVLVLVRRQKVGYCVLTPFAQIELPLSRFRHGRELSVGRSSACDVQLNVEDVSGRHGVFLLLDGQLAFRDENSTNGTCLNEQPITPGVAVILTSGDVLLLGKEATIHIL